MNNIVKYVFTVIVSLLSVSAFAQFRVNHNDESPLRKLQFAEVAISNLYVDKVDEEKLVENASILSIGFTASFAISGSISICGDSFFRQ